MMERGRHKAPRESKHLWVTSRLRRNDSTATMTSPENCSDCQRLHNDLAAAISAHMEVHNRFMGTAIRAGTPPVEAV